MMSNEDKLNTIASFYRGALKIIKDKRQGHWPQYTLPLIECHVKCLWEQMQTLIPESHMASIEELKQQINKLNS